MLWRCTRCLTTFEVECKTRFFTWFSSLFKSEFFFFWILKKRKKNFSTRHFFGIHCRYLHFLCHQRLLTKRRVNLFIHLNRHFHHVDSAFKLDWLRQRRQSFGHLNPLFCIHICRHNFLYNTKDYVQLIIGCWW